MKFRVFLFFLFQIFLTSCASHIQSDAELDRRSGLTPSVNLENRAMNVINGNAHLFSEQEKKPEMPVRSEPVIEKIWVYDQKLGPNWLQGTWYFIEVTPSHWLSDYDPGSARLVTSPTSNKSESKPLTLQSADSKN